MKKVLVVGFICGAIAAVLFHQGTLYVLYHQFPLIRTITGAADALRPANPLLMLRPAGAYGVPPLAWLVLLGGGWGVVLAGLIRWAHLPDLLGGFLFGALVLTLLDLSLGAQLRGLPLWAGGNTLAWWRAVLANGAWGFGTAFLLRPFSLNER